MLAKKALKSQPRGSYHTYTARQQAEIGKWALKNGVQSARRKFSKAQKTEINESTVRSFRNQYRKDLEKWHRDESENATVRVCKLPLKKRGRPLLLGERLDSIVQKYIAVTRKVGGSVSTAVFIAGAKGILMTQDRTRLAEFGGPVTLTKVWAIPQPLKGGELQNIQCH